MINQEVDVSKDILANLPNPEFCDVIIVASDGEIPANKGILAMRSKYFRSMFSSNNNFVESKENTVKMPYTKAVLEKVIIYLYSGKMRYSDMALRPLLNLLDLLNLMNLTSEYSKVEGYIRRNIRGGDTLTINVIRFNLKGLAPSVIRRETTYPIADCLECLDVSSKLGLVNVGETLLSFLGENFVKFCYSYQEVGLISEEMIIRLLEEKGDDRSQTIHRFRTFVTWLSVNSMDTDMKEEVLKTLNFKDFTFKELSSDVRKSGLYSIDQIMERMEELYQDQSKELEGKNKDLQAKSVELAKRKQSLKTKASEVELLQKERIEREKSVHDDMMTVRESVTRARRNHWSYVPAEIKNKYNVP